MAMRREQVEAEARRLPREDRARIAEALIASLDEDAEIEKAWSDEILRRVGEVRSGQLNLVPAADVFSELDEIIRK